MQLKDELKRIVQVAPTMDPSLSEDFPEIDPQTVDPEAHYLEFMPSLTKQSLAAFIAKHAPDIRAEIVSEDESSFELAFYDGERRIRLLGSGSFTKGRNLSGLFCRLYSGLLFTGYTQEEIRSRFPSLYRLHRVGDFIFACENVVAYGSLAAYEEALEKDADAAWDAYKANEDENSDC